MCEGLTRKLSSFREELSQIYRIFQGGKVAGIQWGMAPKSGYVKIET